LNLLHQGFIFWKFFEEFEDAKGVIRVRKSKDRQHNDHAKKKTGTNNDIQSIHIKLKIEYTGAPER
jgi:hypothetical protein